MKIATSVSRHVRQWFKNGCTLVAMLLVASMAGAQSADTTALSGQRIIDNQRLHLNVSNLDASISAFQDVFGMELLRYRPLMNGEFLGTDPGSRLRTAGLRVSGGDFEIELIEWSGATHVPEFRDFQDPGALLFVMDVRDFDERLAGAIRIGWEVITENSMPVTIDGRRSIVLQDPNGYLVQLTDIESDPEGDGAPGPIADMTLWVTVEDLTDTAVFYNQVFHFDLPENVEYRPLDPQMAALFNAPGTTRYREARGAFPGLNFPSIGFQEFQGPVRRPPLRHRVQDPGGPTIPVVVREDDFRSILEDIEANGGIIGQDAASQAIPRNLSGTWWIRDPIGLLYQVETP